MGEIMISLYLIFVTVLAQIYEYRWNHVKGNSNSELNLPYYDYSYGNKVIPGGRIYFSSCEYENTLLIFGGFGCLEESSTSDCNYLLNDIFQYDPGRGKWRFLYGDVDEEWPAYLEIMGDGFDYIGARYRHNSECFGDSLIVFGGIGMGWEGYSIGELNDVWEFDLINSEWRYLRGPFNIISTYNSNYTQLEYDDYDPAYRGRANSVTFTSDSFLIFGGEKYYDDGELELTELCNDMWQYNVTLNLWRNVVGDQELDCTNSAGSYDEAMANLGVETDSGRPASRLGASMWKYFDSVYIFSGLTVYNLEWDHVTDFWKFNMTSLKFTFYFIEVDPWEDVFTTWYGEYNQNRKKKFTPSYWDARPGPREASQFFPLTLGNKLMFGLFGGYGVTDATHTQYTFDNQEDLWIYDPIERSWLWALGEPIPGEWDVNTGKIGPRWGGVASARSSTFFTQGSNEKGISETFLFGGMIWNDAYGWIKMNDLWKLEIMSCFGEDWNDPGVCMARGQCVGSDWCQCEQPYYNPRTGCQDMTCFGTQWNLTEEVCSAHGTCVAVDTCVCELPVYDPATGCGDVTCFGTQWDSNEVCSSHGTCVASDTCECEEIIYNSTTGCEEVYCFDQVWNLDTTCFQGLCVANNSCDCSGAQAEDYYGSECQEFVPGTGEATGTKEEFTVRISFGIPLALYASEFDENDDFPCSKIVAEVDLDVFDIIDGECTWEWGVENEHFGLATDSFSFTPGEDSSLKKLPKTIMVKVLTSEEKVEVSLDDQRKNEKEKKTFADLWPAVVFPAGGVLFCISATITIGVLITCLCIFVRFGVVNIDSNLDAADMTSKNHRKMEQVLKDEDIKALAKINVNKALFKIDYKDLEIGKSLGKGGSSAIVFRCLWKGRDVAFKCFQTRDLTGTTDSFKEFEKEVEILASIRHPSVCDFYGATLAPPRVGIVMEFCAGGELREVLVELFENDEPMELGEKVRILMEVASGVEYLHDRNIIHRDLKLANVLLTDQNKAKIIDFGISKVVDEANAAQLKTKRVGTSHYMAPEVTRGEDYNEKCDVFSFGIMLYECLSDNYNPYGKSQFSLEMKVANDPSFRPDLGKIKLHLPKDVCEWTIPLVRACWAHTPSSRPDFTIIFTTLKERKVSQVLKVEEEEDSKKKSHVRKKGLDRNSFAEGSLVLGGGDFLKIIEGRMTMEKRARADSCDIVVNDDSSSSSSDDDDEAVSTPLIKADFDAIPVETDSDTSSDDVQL